MDPRRIDSQKLEFHPHRVAQWRDANDWEKAKEVYPIYVELSPVGACNHRCTFCAVDYIGYEARRLDPPILQDRFAEMGRIGIKSIMFAGEGEPLLHKDIDWINEEAVSNGIDTSFTTNGVLLDRLESIYFSKWVKVSVNAGTKETYAKVHRTKESDWDRVWEGIRRAVQRKGDCEIGVQMVALPENDGEWKELQALASDAGVDYVVVKPYSQHKSSITRRYEGYKPVQVIHGPNLVVRDAAIQTQGHGYDRCHSTPFFWAYIMASGDVYSCSAYLLDDRFRLGNINDESFSRVWGGDRRKANWEMMKSHDISECRVNCRMQRCNEYLAGFETVKNVNFI